jgi:uncharacterized protein (DUF305 family)
MSIKSTTALVALSLAALSLPLALPAMAQDMMSMDHSSMQGGASTKAFEAANAKMHKSMMIEYSGDTDTDFVRSMIPHHQGAIDMAKVELAHGKDPELRKLAQDIVKAQESEIAEMQAWLKAHGQK